MLNNSMLSDLHYQIVNTATVDLEDVRMYRNAIRSRSEMVRKCKCIFMSFENGQEILIYLNKTERICSEFMNL